MCHLWNHCNKPTNSLNLLVDEWRMFWKPVPRSCYESFTFETNIRQVRLETGGDQINAARIAKGKWMHINTHAIWVSTFSYQSIMNRFLYLLSIFSCLIKCKYSCMNEACMRHAACKFNGFSMSVFWLWYYQDQVSYAIVSNENYHHLYQWISGYTKEENLWLYGQVNLRSQSIFNSSKLELESSSFLTYPNHVTCTPHFF